MKLLQGSINGVYRVKGIALDMAIERRLEMLGVTEGTCISILNKKSSGSMIFKVRGTRFAIGKKIAEGILVEVI